MIVDDRDRVRKRLERRLPTGVARVNGVTYDLVGGEERVDRRVEDELARKARERFETERADRLAGRQGERDELTLGARLDRALIELELGKGTRARPIATARSSSGDPNPMGAHPGAVFEVDVSEPLRWIRHHVEQIERALDAELGLLERAPVGDRPGAAGALESARMTATEFRDGYVFDQFQGERSDVVAEQAPYLGSARTIERARLAEAERRGLKVKPVTGEITGEATVSERLARGELRRVRIS